MKYIKLPDIVDARQLFPENVEYIAGWCGGKIFKWGVKIPGPEASVSAEFGDYIIEKDGLFYVCKPDVFNQRYKQL